MSDPRPVFEKHYVGLDILRVVAITLVMLIHFAKRAFTLSDVSFKQFILWGWHGVDLFFVLSGFLIGGQIIEAIQARRFSLKEFYIKRLWRIFPPYYVSLLLIAAVYFGGYQQYFRFAVEAGRPPMDVLKNLAIHFAYLQNYLQWNPPIQHGVYWSLAVEEQFYLLAPIVVLALSRSAKGVVSGIVSLILIAVSLRFILYATGAGLEDLLRPFHTRFDNLLIGILAAFVFIRYREAFAGSIFWKSAFLLTAAFCLGLTIKYGSYADGYFNLCWQFTLTGSGFSALILFVMSLRMKTLNKEHRTLNLLARISYPMYLYHLVLITPVVYSISFLSGYYDQKSYLTFVVVFGYYFVIVSLFSWMTYRLVDEPCRRLRDRMLEEKF